MNTDTTLAFVRLIQQNYPRMVAIYRLSYVYVKDLVLGG
jgi:hypothetical protein